MVPASPSMDEMLMIDPRPGGFHRRYDGANTEEDAGQVDVEDAMPLGEFVVLDDAHVDDAGVVDQDVDAAELVDRGGDDTTASRRVE